MFLRNAWYVFSWNDQLSEAGKIVGRVVLGEPVVVWRSFDGSLNAMEDRCPHRHAPLSMGRVEGQALRCMYHGLKFDRAGMCVHVPGVASPPAVTVRTYPVVEKDDWIWIWMGQTERADPSAIPDAFGIRAPGREMRAGQMEYDAHYQLVHDNLCDLSHVDFVHETTLRPITGASWSETFPQVKVTDRGVHFERWFVSAQTATGGAMRVDTWSTYDFVVPGVFIMRAARYPEGTAALSGYGAPTGAESINETIEQQAVTPIDSRRTAYFFATGVVDEKAAHTPDADHRIALVKATFDEDRAIIQGQQRIWDLTPDKDRKIFLPQDKGAFLMRKLIDRLIRQEAAAIEELS